MRKNGKNNAYHERNWWLLASTVAFAVFGIVLLVVGFGISDGWDSVLKWFSSRWAIYVYILVGFLAFLVAYIVFEQKMGDE